MRKWLRRKYNNFDCGLPTYWELVVTVAYTAPIYVIPLTA